MSKQSINPLPDDDWETSLTKRIARNIARAKDEVGLTTEQLAALCSTFLGKQGAVKATTLNGLFAGKRKSVSAAELVMFSACLDVPVLALLTAPFDTDVEIRPGRSMPPLRALMTLSGLEPVITLEPNPLNMRMQRPTDAYFSEAGLVEVFYLHNSAGSEFYDAFVALMQAIEADKSELILEQFVRGVQWRLEELKHYRQKLVESNVSLPPLTHAFDFIDEIPSKNFTLEFARAVYPIYVKERAEFMSKFEARPRGVGDGSPA